MDIKKLSEVALGKWNHPAPRVSKYETDLLINSVMDYLSYRGIKHEEIHVQRLKKFFEGKK